MLALAHAMAQAIGGRYGLPHGTLNGICLPPVLRFNTAFAPDAVTRFGEAVGDPADPAGRVAGRGWNLANPNPASPDEIEQLLRDVY